MADSNNHLVTDLPKKPNAQLKALGDRLIGKWEASGPDIEGTVAFEWLEGGYFLVQHVDFVQGGTKIKGIEYVGYDVDTDTLRSHYMDNNGSNFTYTWALEGDTLKIWFGDKDSEYFYEGVFNEDGTVNTGGWTYPDGGGYKSTMKRIGS